MLKSKNLIQKFLFYSAIVCLILGGFDALVQTWQFIFSEFGKTFGIISLLFFPLTLGIAPLYMLIAYGDFHLIILNYGFWILPGIYMFLSGLFDDKAVE